MAKQVQRDTCSHWQVNLGGNGVYRVLHSSSSHLDYPCVHPRLGSVYNVWVEGTLTLSVNLMFQILLSSENE